MFARLKNMLTSATPPSTEEKAALQRWLVQPEEQQLKTEVLFAFWSELASGADETTFASYRKTRRKINRYTHPARRRLTAWLVRAAVFLVPLLSVTASYFYIRNHTAGTEMVQCIVPNGQQNRITLPDGSSVTVNSGSTLVYPQKFTGKERSVFLLGEANFEVAKNKAKPFIVKTGHLEIEALGTTFNVCAYPESNVTATLESGSIKVGKKNRDDVCYILLPNEQLEYTPGTDTFTKRTADASLYSGWTKGELNFVRQSLPDIVAALQREYDVRFILNLPHVPSDLYTIKFKRRDSLDKVLKIVSLTVGNMDYRIDSEHLVTLYPVKKKGGNT